MKTYGECRFVGFGCGSVDRFGFRFSVGVLGCGDCGFNCGSEGGSGFLFCGGVLGFSDCRFRVVFWFVGWRYFTDVGVVGQGFCTVGDVAWGMFWGASVDLVRMDSGV